MVDETPRPRSNYNRVLQQIIAKIDSEGFCIGDRLPSQRELKEEFGVSRATLREALRTLQSKGVLEITHGKAGGAILIDKKGAPSLYITQQIDFAESSRNDLVELWSWLLQRVAQLSCQNGSDDQFDTIIANLSELSDIKPGSYNRFYREAVTRAFSEFANSSGNQAFLAVTLSICKSLLDIPGSVIYSKPFHAQMIENIDRTLRARDMAGLSSYIAAHFTRN